MSTLVPDAPREGVHRVVLDAVPLAVVQYRGVVLADLPPLFDEGFAALAARFRSGELVPAGPALAVYRGDPAGRFDLEVGHPVAAAPDAAVTGGDGGAGPVVVASSLPEGPAAAASHLGPYDGLGEAWRRLVAAAGGEPAGAWVELYVSDPGDPSELVDGQLRTDLLLPLR